MQLAALALVAFYRIVTLAALDISGLSLFLKACFFA